VNALWLDNERLVTAGLDGKINLLGTNFEVQRTWHLPHQVRDFSVGRGSIDAVSDDSTVWRIWLDTGREQTTSINARFAAFATSPDRNTIAVGTVDGELFLIDRQFHVSVRRPSYSEHERIQCVAFEDDATLVTCHSNGRVMRTQLRD